MINRLRARDRNQSCCTARSFDSFLDRCNVAFIATSFRLLLSLVMVSIWLSGNALDSINAVTLRRARLVPGWVTVLGRVNHLGTVPDTQVDSA